MSRSLIPLMAGLVRRIRLAVNRKNRYPVLYNVNGVDESQYRKRALIIYLARAFLLSPGAPELLNHQNLRRCRSIAALLDEFGYVVDLVDVSDRRFTPDRTYDLVVKDRVRLKHVEPAPTGTIRLLLATTTNHVVHNRNLRRRHELLFRRRGQRIQLRRVYDEN